MPPRLLLALLLGPVAAVAAVADTGTPYPAGTTVEVTTTAGTVVGTLKDRPVAGWLLVQESGRAQPTAIPDKAVGFLRVGPAAPPQPVTPPGPLSVTAAAHVLHGRPRVTDPTRFAFRTAATGPEVAGVTVLTRLAFTVGHYDRFKTPAWVAMKWTKKEYDVSEIEPKHKRPFRADTELPAYAQTSDDYQHSQFKYQRGHMARHEDLSGFAAPGNKFQGTQDGCLMSNIVPQKQAGHTVWGDLENEHREIVADPAAGVGPVWLIAGPVFINGKAVEVIGPDKVGAPHAVYKVIAWKEATGALTARGYVIHQHDTNRDLTRYLTSIDAIEAATGLDFFPDMPAAAQATLEARTFTTLWGPD